MQDWQLLQEFVKNGSQAAFGQLVERHLNFVYSTCLREVEDCGLAEDATQVVFLLLSQKANTLKSGTVLAGWLFQTARFVAKNTRKQEVRWRERNRKAAEAMIHEAKTLPAAGATLGTEEDAWAQIKPLLNDAMEDLSALDRNAVLLRCFEGRSLRATGEVLGLSEEATRKRIARALEKLRRYFMRHGVTLSAVGLASLLTGHAVQAAPVGLAAATVTVTSAAIPVSLSATTVSTATTATASFSTGSAVGGKALALAELAENVKRAWLLVKIKTAATAVCGVSLAAAGMEQIVRHAHAPPSRPQIAHVTPQNRSTKRHELVVLPQTKALIVTKTSAISQKTEQNQPAAEPVEAVPIKVQSNSFPEKVKKKVVAPEQNTPPRANERNEAMQVKSQVKKTVAATILKTTMLTGALTASLLPAMAQPDVKQPGMAGDKTKAAARDQVNTTVLKTTRVMGMPGMPGVGMFSVANGQMNQEMLRSSLKMQGVTDEATLNAILEHVKRVDEARQALNKKAEPMRAGMAPNTALADAQFSVLFNEYQAAVEDYKAVRENSARQLDEKIGYSKKTRLHATLMTLGIVGDAPQGGFGFGNSAIELYTTLQKAPVQLMLDAAPVTMALPGGFAGAPGAELALAPVRAGAAIPGAALDPNPVFDVFAAPPVAVNVDALAKVPPIPATNEQIEALRRDLDAQIKALREEMERLKVEKKVQTQQNAPVETVKP